MTTIDPRATEAAASLMQEYGLPASDSEVELILSAAQPFMVREGLTQDRLDKLSDDIAEAVQWWQIKGPKDREWKGIMGFVQEVIDKIPVASPPPSADEVERVARAITKQFYIESFSEEEIAHHGGIEALVFKDYSWQMEWARAAIAAMYRAPQRSYEDGLRRAAEKIRALPQLHLPPDCADLENSSRHGFREGLRTALAYVEAELTQPQGEGK